MIGVFIKNLAGEIFFFAYLKGVRKIGRLCLPFEDGIFLQMLFDKESRFANLQHTCGTKKQERNEDNEQRN